MYYFLSVNVAKLGMLRMYFFHPVKVAILGMLRMYYCLTVTMVILGMLRMYFFLTVTMVISAAGRVGASPPRSPEIMETNIAPSVSYPPRPPGTSRGWFPCMLAPTKSNSAKQYMCEGQFACGVAQRVCAAGLGTSYECCSHM